MRRALLVGGVVVILASAAMLAFGGHRIANEQAAYLLPAAGQCVPSKLNVSDVLPGTGIAVSPLPESLDASPDTQISLLGVSVKQLRDVKVSGSQTGLHPGSLRAYSQGDGGSFVPEKPFRSGEIVTVAGTDLNGAKPHKFAYHFAVAFQDPIPPTTGPTPAAKPGELLTLKSEPSLHPPVVTVSALSSSASKGDIFLAPYHGSSQYGPMILSESGQLVWFNPLPYGVKATNLQVQHYEGRPVLTWWQGWIPPQGFGEGEGIVDNTSYQRILTVQASNGYKADLHNFQLMPDHTALLTVFNPIHCNLTEVGGPQGAAVTDSGYQEIDVRTGLVRRQWFPIDHVSFAASYIPATGASSEWPYDYFHLNSIDQKGDEKTLISSRNTSALYELDTRTGQVVTEIGGKRSSVKMDPGTSTAYQHDASTLSDGDISVFDNGGTGPPPVHSQSRALIEQLNDKDHTVKMVAQFEHPNQPLAAASQGSTEALEDGNIFVGWGAQPYFSEFSAAGKLLYEGHLPGSTESYRTFRFQWNARPASPPSITVEDPAGAPTVFASWNGATSVASWEPLGGSSPEELAPITTVPSSGFETTISASAPEAYVQVKALNVDGEVIGTSSAVKG